MVSLRGDLAVEILGLSEAHLDVILNVIPSQTSDVNRRITGDYDYSNGLHD